MKTRRIITALFLPIAIGVLTAVAIAKPASAAADENIMRTVYNALLYRCYTGGYVNSIVENENQDLWHESFDDNKNIFKAEVASVKSALLPNGWTTVSGDSLSCVELFAGNAGTFSGFKSMYNLPTENKALLDKLGYDLAMTGLSGATKQTCFKPVFTLGTALEVNSNGWLPGGWERQGSLTNTSTSNGPEACFETDASGTITAKGTKGDASSQHGDGSVLSYDLVFDGNILEFIVNTSAARPAIDLVYNIGETKVSDLISAMQSELEGKEINVTTNTRVDDDPVTGQARRTRQVLVYNDITTSEKNNSSLTTGTYNFCNNNAVCASNRAGQNIFGTSNRALSESQVATIYLDYINRYTTYTCNENDAGTKVRLKIGSEWKTCAISYASKDTFNGVDSNRLFGVTVSLNDIIDYLGATDYENVEGLERENNTGIVTPPPSEEGGEATTASEECYGSPGTLGMSWLLCPVLSGLSNTLNGVYNNIVQDYLVVEPSLVTNQNTYNAWQFFQNVSNIIVVILLLVVIFSQLTGVGIDNYGIKKILPRLIICAILINLSYLIVQLLVDVSNIVGNSIANIFNISSIQIEASDYQSLSIASHVLGIAVGAGGVIGVAAVVANPAILLSFLGVLLTGLISVLVMWLILTARKAGVVIAMVLAPVAFAMYLLPNTSKFAKSWVNLIKALLLVYPLASLLIGASFFASDLLANSSDGNMILPAMLLRVVPFLALPTLFKKSLDAFGNLGTKIQGFGQTLGRGATGALRNADWYKNAQERGIERRTRIRAGLDQNGQEQTNPLLRQLRSRNDRTRSRYRSQYLKNQAEQDRASLLNDPRYMEEMRFKQDLAIEGERNEIELMNDPTYRDTLRAKQDSDIEKKQTEAQASALGRGAFVRTDGAAVDGTRTDSLRDALIFEASRANNEQDIGRIRALYDALRAKGDSGIDALDEAWDSGTLQGRGFELIRDNIASDGEIKSKARSLHATANAVQSGALAYDTAGGQVASARANGQYIRSIAADKIPDLTGHELRALSTAARTGNADASEVLYLAFTNRDIARKIKPTDATLVQEGASQHVLAQNIERVDGGLYEYTDPNSGARLARRIEVTRDGRFRYQAGTNNLITDQEFTAQNYTPR